MSIRCHVFWLSDYMVGKTLFNNTKTCAMVNIKTFYVILILLLSLGHTGNSQTIYNPSLNIITSSSLIDSLGFVEYTTTNASAGDARFTLFGDGFFDTQNNFGHQFPSDSLGFVTTTFFNRRYKKNKPKKRERFTGSTGSGSGSNMKINMNSGVESRVATSWSPCLNIENYFLLIFENISSTPDSGCVVFYYDSTQLSLNNSGILEYGWVTNKQNDVVSGSKLYNKKITWDFDTMISGEQRVVYIPMTSIVKAGTRLSLGSEYKSGCSGGSGISGSSATSSGWPHDPNSKVANKDTVLPDTITQQSIIYTVTFQNEGTAPANTVVLIDEIDEARLDLTTLQYIDSEYSCNFTLEGNTLEIVFPNIQLPGSKQIFPKKYSYDETESYVLFKICTKTNLIALDTIMNQVDIYFDSQPPISTNISKIPIIDIPSTIDECVNSLKPTGLLESTVSDISISPNPVENTLILNGIEDQVFTLFVYNNRGELVMSKPRINEENNSIEIINLPRGLYFVQLKNEMLNITRKVIKL